MRFRAKPEMNIRHLRYFVALARERHHARAAAACHVTQPTLSEAIRQLERELAVPLIYREGQRFGGLTAEGERALDWARRILADQEALEQELAEMRVGLSGDLHFGVIPAAMPAAPSVTSAFCRNHPLVTLKVLSLSSIEIQRGLDAAELDAGLTYLDNEPLHNVRAYPLYGERYLLLTPAGARFDGATAVSWREAARLPLCLLTPNMQHRRIIDSLFVAGNAGKPRVSVETDSAVALLAYVRSGEWSSVIPHTFLTLLGQDAGLDGLRAVPLIEPESIHTVGLVVGQRDPLPPLARALLKSARHSDVSAALDRLLPKAAR
jgi:DNA-binding transcriptional LysR family regulator